MVMEMFGLLVYLNLTWTQNDYCTLIWFLLADQWLICFSQPMGNNLFGMT